MKNLNNYCESLINYKRRKSRIVNIGDIALGGSYPIRVQSMTTTNTMDTDSTVQQSIRMIEAGCEYVRITAPSVKDARNLKNIKKELKRNGYRTPIIADIHFTPNAALEAARIVEKVRINPGNFADRKRFEHIEYTDQSYKEELDRIHDRFIPLVKLCKEEGTAMRIGANHGSLSDRILSRYGDTPLGMVESAMEFIRICEDYGYYEIVLSMKASNTRVMVQAYRLLVEHMNAEHMDYPLHLGVTEAGEGEDGRIKSSVGIGTLMEDGLGDTIRVSLTEDPELEIPVAQTLVNRYKMRSKHKKISDFDPSILSPYEYRKRKTKSIFNIGDENIPRVIVDASLEKKIELDTFLQVGYSYYSEEDKWGIGDFACDYLYVGSHSIDIKLPGTLGIIQDYSTWIKHSIDQHYPLLQIKDYLDNKLLHESINFIQCEIDDITKEFIHKLKSDSTAVLIIYTQNEHAMAEMRRLIVEMLINDCMVPIIIKRQYHNINLDTLQLYSSTDVGGLLIDGYGDGVFLSTLNCGTLKQINETIFGILQASRSRISKTEYISCPSCGRTLFDLQETTALIRSRTSHLKGIKIGIMGCIVNGPGEMADADYGYVGTGVGKISLFI